MIRLIDGPAAGVYAVRRAPSFLRAVVGPDRQLDVLDQLDDRPEPGEKVHVYRLREDGPRGAVQICGPRGVSGRYAIGEYVHLADVDGEQLRRRGDWREWCRLRAIAELEAAEAAV